MSLAEQIRQRRLERRLSLPAAATEIGASARSLSYWEAGEVEPRGLYRRALERWLSAGEADDPQAA